MGSVIAAVLLGLAGGYGPGELSMWAGRHFAPSKRSHRSNRNMNFPRRRDFRPMRLSKLNHSGGGRLPVAAELPAYAASALRL